MSSGVKKLAQVAVGAVIGFVQGGPVGALIGAGLAFYAAEQQEKLNTKSPLRDNEPSAQTLRSSKAPVRFILGRAATGGVLAWGQEQSGTVGDGEWLHMVYVLCEGGIDSLENIYLGEEEIATFGEFASYELIVNPTQVNAFLLANCPGWKDSQIGRGLSFVRVSFRYSAEKFPSGIPDARFVVRGSNDIYDPRSGTSGYSANTALHILWYLRTRCGVPDDEIVFSTFASAANVCDETITNADGSVSQRYRTACVIGADEQRTGVLQKLEAACAGKLIRVGGRWMLQAGAYYGPYDFEITEDMVVGTITGSTEPTNDSAINTVRGTFIDPSQSWTETDYPEVQVDQWVVEDGGEAAETLTFSYVTDPYQAQRLANIELRRRRAGGTISIPMNLSGYNCRPGRVIRVNLPSLNILGEFIVTNWSMGNKDGCSVSVAQYEPAIFSDAVGQPYNPIGFINLPAGGLGSPTNLSWTQDASAEVTQGILSWLPPSGIVKEYIVIVRQGATAIQSHNVPATSTERAINGLPSGNYTMSVAAVGPMARSGEATISVSVNGPPIPEACVVQSSIDSITLIPSNTSRGLNGGTYEYFFSTVPSSDPDDAVYVGRGLTFTHTGLGFFTNYYYFVRSANAYGKSAFLYVPASTSNDVGAYLDALDGKLNETQLGQSLVDRIDLIDGPPTLPGSVSNRVNELSEQVGAVTDHLQELVNEGQAALTEAQSELQLQIDQVSTVAKSGEYQKDKAYSVGASTRLSDRLYQAKVVVPADASGVKSPPNATYWVDVGQVVSDSNGLAARVSTTETKITSIEGVNTSQGTAITGLTNSLTTTNTNVSAAQNAANAANTLAGGKGKVLVQTAAPAAADQLAQNLWIDITGGANTPKRWTGSAWAAVTDKVATDAAAAAANALTVANTKADASAVNSLTTRVAATEGSLTSQGNSITSLNNSIGDIGSQNLLYNPAFTKTGSVAGVADGWDMNPPGVIGASTGVYSLVPSWINAAEKSQRIEVTGINESTLYRSIVVSVAMRPTVQAGASVALSVYFRATAGLQVRLYLQAIDGAGAVISGPSSGFLVATGATQRATLIVASLPVGTAKVIPYLRIFGSSGVTAGFVEFTRAQLETGSTVSGWRDSALTLASEQAATSAALSTLTSTVTQQGASLTSQGASITSLTNSLTTTEGFARAAAAQGANLVIDGDLSQGVPLYQLPSAVFSVVAMSNPSRSNKVLKAVANGAIADLQFQPFKISGGRWLYAECYVKTEVFTSGNYGLYATIIRSDGTADFKTFLQRNVDVGSAWVKFSGTVQMVSDAVEVRMRYSTRADLAVGSTIYFTDMVVIDVTEAKAASDLAATKADSSAVTALTTRVTAAEGAITSQSNSITTLTNNLGTAGGQNLLYNSSFERVGPTAGLAEGWTIGVGSGGLTTTPSLVASGIDPQGVSQRIAITGLSSGAQNYCDLRITGNVIGGFNAKILPSVAPGQMVTMSAWVKATAGLVINLFFQFKNAAQATILTEGPSTIVATGAWQRVVRAAAVAAPADTVATDLLFRVRGASATVVSGDVEWDQAQLEVGSAATGWKDSTFVLAYDQLATSAALSSLSSTVTQQGATLTSQGSSITGLTNSLTTTNTNVTAAQNAANAANTLAGGKGKVLVQTAAPSAADQLAQNLWIDITGGANTPKRWTGSAWAAVTDKVATDAAAAAANALSVANTKADASAVNSLTTRVTATEGTISSQGDSITSLNNRVSQVGQNSPTRVYQSLFSALASDQWRLNSASLATMSFSNVAGNLSGATLTFDCGTGKHWWGATNKLIRFDPSRLYKVSARVQQVSTVAGNTQTYLGLDGYAEDGVTRISTTGGNTSSSAHYVLAGAKVLEVGVWTEFSTYVKGFTIGAEGGGAGAGTLADPKRMKTGIAWISPMGIFGYNNVGGVAALDYFWIEDVTEQVEIDATSSALSSLSSTVTQQGTTLTSQGSSITGLTNSLTTTNTNVTAAQNAANTANTLAGGKGKVLVQTAAPAAADQLAQNLWIDITGGANTPKRWTGSAWVAVTDKVAADAAAAAASALSVANTKADASAVSSLTTRVTSTEEQITAQATKLDGIYVQVNPVLAGDASGYAGSTASLVGVWSEQSARIEDGIAIGRKVDTVQAVVDANNATVQQVSQAQAGLDGKVSAMWTVKLQVNAQGQYVAAGVGLGIENGPAGLQSTFLVSADTFAVVNGVNGALSSPFAVTGGQVFIRSAFIQDLSLSFGKIADNIQSDNYVANSTGWKLSKAGGMELNSTVPGQGRVQVTNRAVKVWDANGVLRVQLGDLSA